MNTLNLSSRTSFLEPSPTLAMNARVRSMCRAGIDVISLAAGEPDFDTPEPVCEAAIQALRDGMTRYTPTSGIPELKEAICVKMLRENGMKTHPDQIVVSCGAKHSLYNTMMVLVEPGDEIILIAPYWATYREQILLAGGVPVVVQVDSTTHFLPSVEQIKEKITPRTKAILLNTPNNPTGAVYPRSLLKEIAAVCLRYGLWVIVDEIYERLVYEGEHVSIAALGHEIAEQTVTISGCSKTYAMTGWRIGFSVSPPCVAKAIANLQDQVTSNATSFAQIGALKALELPEGVVGEMRREYRVRRGLILEMLRDIEGLSVPTPHGAFYVMPYVGKYLHDGVTDSRLAEAILEKVNVAVVPGSVFYGEGYLRLSYAASQEDIRKGMERLAYFFKEIDHMIK